MTSADPLPDLSNAISVPSADRTLPCTARMRFLLDVAIGHCEGPDGDARFIASRAGA
jgi:hypothetical protein